MAMTKVKFDALTGFNNLQLQKVKAASELIEKVVNSQEFKDAVINFSFPVTTCSGWLWRKRCSTVTQKGYHYTDETGQQVYDRFMTGAEVLKPDADHTINVDLTLVTGSSGVLGYTYPDTLKTYIARWFVDSATPAELAMNIVHEWCHKIGYDHEYRSTALRQYSVPYAVGYLVGRLAD